MQLALDLERIFSESTCIVGVGNPLRNDDAVGAMIADRLGGDGSALEGVTVINVEDVIENYVFTIAAGSATNVLLIDAVCGDGTAEPGSVVLGRLEDMEVGLRRVFHPQADALNGGQHSRAPWQDRLSARDRRCQHGLRHGRVERDPG
jgi:hypothetical protein